MNEEQLQLLWDLNAKDAGFTDYNEFKTLMGDSTARKTYFDITNSQLGFTDYSEFESLLGLGGAQEVSAQGSADTSQTLGQPSSSSTEPSLVKFDPEREREFQDWYQKVAQHKGLDPNPDSPQHLYDYRAFYQQEPELANQLLTDDPDAHFTDIGKLPGHPTFSDESMYFNENNKNLAGRWDGEIYIPYDPSKPVINMETGEELKNYNRTTSSADLDDKRSYDKYTKRTTYADVPEGLDVRQAVDLGSGVRGLSAVDPNTGEITNVIPEVEVSAPIPFSVNMKNTWENVKTQLQGVDDRLKLVSADTWENLLGKELARAWYANVGERDIEQVRLDAYEELQRLEEAIRPTSSIGGSISRGDLIGAVSGIINATAQLGTTAIVAVPTAGVGLYTEMVGQSIYDYNKAKAEHLGLEIDELYNQGKAEFGVPAFIGILGGSLERVGFKGARNAITAAMGSGIGRSLVKVGLGANQEGMTEWLQYGLQELNTALADPDVTQEEALSAFTSAIFSEEGVENYLMGLAGSGVAAGLGGAGKFISKRARDKFSASAETIRNINQDLNNGDISPVTRAVLEDSKQTAVSEMASIIAEDAAVEGTLSPEVRNNVEGRLNDLEAVQEALQDPNISEQTKVALQQQAEQLSTEIDNLIAETDAIQERETEAVPVGERAQDSQEVDGEIREQAEETEVQQEGQQEQIVEETQATEPGQIFTRDIGGEQTVYRRNEDGTATIVPDAEAQKILNQPTETPVQESVQAEEVDSVQQSEAFMNPEQTEPMNTILEDIGFAPEESTSFLQDIQTEKGRSNRKQAAADRIRQYWQSQQNLGIANQQNPEEFARFIRDVAEYAAVSILDGSIRTAKGLAKAIGVTYDESIQRAFEQAQVIVQPIQEATVTPPRTTTKGQIIRTTDGGIQGSTTLSNRQALKTQIQTLNRGIREGRKQITESRKEITDFIKGMKEAGLFRGKVRGSTVNALLNRVNKANTSSQLRNALDYAEKASRIIDYDQKLSTANTLKSRAKRLAKRKGIPADLVPVLKGMGSINTRYIDNIGAFNEQLAELISAVDGAGIDGIEQTQHRDLITSVKNKIEQARIQALKDQLIDAGMGSDFVDTLNTMNQLLEAVASIPDESKPSGESKREFRERIYEQTKELLGELDRTELSPQQSVALDALLGIDVSQVSDQMMAAIAVVGKNAAVNQSFAGAGPIIAEYRLQQETSNQKNVDKVKSTVRIASRIGKATRERFGTVIAQIDAVMRDQQAASAFYALTGFGDILEGSTRYGHRADGVKKIVEDLSKKHAKDLSDSVQSAMYAMYADLNQYKNTWTEEQRVEEFNKRKEAIQTSIDRIEEQMGRDKHFEAQQRDYLSNVTKAWEQVKSAKHPDEIYDKLNNGFKAAYSEMRGFYDSILPEMQDNALIHNNTDLDTDWVNYFPRSYKKLGRPATERKIEQIEEMAGSMGIPLDDIVNQGESSGAKQNRVITGAQLPANATINFDAFNSFYDSSLRALYDIETQPARQYAARALNSGRVAEIFGDATPLEIFRNATIQKIGNDQLGLYGGTTGWFRSALRAMSTWGTRLALGGVGQFVKQSIPQMSDTVVRLGNNAHLLAVGLSGYLKYNYLLNEAIKDQPVSRRNVATVERQTSVINKRELNEIRKGLSTGVLRGLRIADEVVEAISLSSLKWGDDTAAKASWLAFYLEYKKRNGETVVDLASELQNPSKDAKAYATQRLELTNNVSDPSLRSNTSKHIAGELLAVIAPFSSFAINAKLELATSLSRLRELGVMSNQERLRTVRNVGGNVANILVYNVIGKMIRNVMIGGTASLAYALLNNDDWDEDDEKAARELIDTWKSDAIARNEENSTEYLVNDLIFGGIAERSLQPGIDVIKDLYAKAKGEQPKERFTRPRTIYDALGIFGIPARTAGRFFNDLSEWTMTDAEWQMRKFSIEDSWGETRYVPLEYRGINRPIFSRKGFGLTTLAHGVALTGASSQEVSALANRLPGLISQIETKLHGRDRKDKLVENESLRKIRVAGQTKELTEEQWKWTVNERRKFLEEVETSDSFVTLQKNELASKVGDELSEKIRRETATKYARAKAIIEFNLVEGVGEKIAKDAKKKASDIISAADLWKKQLNPNTYPKQEQ